MDGIFRERQVCTINTSEFEFPVVTRPLPFTQFRVTASNAERTFGKELRRRSVARDDRLLLETVQKILGPHNVEAANGRARLPLRRIRPAARVWIVRAS